MKCKICGKEMEERYMNNDTLRQHRMCFSCNFWREHLVNDKKLAGQHKTCMIDGTHYIICDEDSKSSFRGFGGARFQIEFNDGTRVITTNLWCQGEPEGYWKQHFPDNARFENNLKWTKIGNCSYLCEEK